MGDSINMVSALGRTTFEDASIPVPGKSEFGMDTLTRKMTGYVGDLVAFIASLHQGDTFNFNGILFYLQTWNPDDATPVSTVTLGYKGLASGGTPTPDVQTEIVSATGSTSSSFSDENAGLGRAYRQDLLWTLTNAIPSDSLDSGIVGTGKRTRYTTGATMQFTYAAVQSRYRYVRVGKPNGPIYTNIDIPAPPILLDQVRIVLSDGAVYGREKITEFELHPVGKARVISFSSSHVIGSPFWECEDVVRYQLEDDTI